jgi:5-methylcytosine-specific restriction endonuclease McrA
MASKKIAERIRGRALQRLRAAWFMRHPLCVSCESKGQVRLATELDHIIALGRGGTNDLSNFQGLCQFCHSDKTRRDMGWKAKHETGLDGWPVENARTKSDSVRRGENGSNGSAKC